MKQINMLTPLNAAIEYIKATGMTLIEYECGRIIVMMFPDNCVKAAEISPETHPMTVFGAEYGRTANP